jgi:hypothetical protein
MEGLERIDRNILRQVILKAEDNKIITKEESGFIITLVERFRGDIEKKIKQLHVLKGEINQLQVNEQIIVSLISNMISAEERNNARNETIGRIRGSVPTKDDDIANEITNQ